MHRPGRTAAGHLIAALGLSLVGCMEVPQDDASSGAPSPFAGTWVYSDSVFDCLHTAIFGKKNGQDAYEFDMSCSLRTGGYGMQVETGNYTVSDGGVTDFVPTQVTCAGVANHTATITSIGGAALSIQGIGQTQVYSQVNASPPPTGATFGCFDSDGSFTARNLGSP